MRIGTRPTVTYRPESEHSSIVLGLFAFIIGIIFGWLLYAAFDSLDTITTYF